MTKKKFDVTKHSLVPKHLKLSDKEKKEILDLYRISLKELPKIRKKDSGIAHLEVKEGDVIKIIRPSATAGESIFFRVVVSA
ncbi:DNA-directed RNA polymerase subunit H [Candidatus Woesearchaeota archaeon]|nr:DNA-directed RNA polymerase subunit H [Candidatus Woesearchaeota archaeon]